MSNLSLYGQYIQEREQKQIIENEHGFLTFKIQGDECYIEDIFVKKGSRLTGAASAMADAAAVFAIEAGCKYLTGTCVPSTNGATGSLKTMFAYGFRLHACIDDKIILIKEL